MNEKHGQFVWYKTGRGEQAVFLHSKSPALEDWLHAQRMREREEAIRSNSSVLQNCARGVLEYLDILKAVDVDYEYPELDDFEALLERIINND